MDTYLDNVKFFSESRETISWLSLSVRNSALRTSGELQDVTTAADHVVEGAAAYATLADHMLELSDMLDALRRDFRRASTRLAKQSQSLD